MSHSQQEIQVGNEENWQFIFALFDDNDDDDDDDNNNDDDVDVVDFDNENDANKDSRIDNADSDLPVMVTQGC